MGFVSLREYDKHCVNARGLFRENADLTLKAFHCNCWVVV